MELRNNLNLVETESVEISIYWLKLLNLTRNHTHIGYQLTQVTD